MFNFNGSPGSIRVRSKYPTTREETEGHTGKKGGQTKEKHETSANYVAWNINQEILTKYRIINSNIKQNTKF